MTADFDWIRTSPIALPDWSQFRFRSLREMIFQTREDSEKSSPILAGVVDGQSAVVALSDLQQAVLRADDWCVEHQIKSGDRVAIVRLPYASELVVAVNAIALMAAGVSVTLPMHSGHDVILETAARTNCRFLLAPAEPSVLREHKAAALHMAHLQAVRTRFEISDCRIPVSFPIESRQFCAEQSQALQNDLAPLDMQALDSQEERLILTTSGTSGSPKFVRYSERALLAVAEAWQAAGLFEIHKTGGTSLCPLLSHSMGLRNVLHAIWNRQRTLLIPPEWIDEAPHRALCLLQEWPPQHFTGGPALIQTLAKLADKIPEARRALRSLKTIVSSGTAWDDQTAAVFSNVHFANAYGTTETQQVLSSLINGDGSSGNGDARNGDAVRLAAGNVFPAHRSAVVLGAHERLGQSFYNGEVSSADRLSTHSTSGGYWLGEPLPGVTVGVKFSEHDLRRGRLFIRSSFNAIGYVGEPDFSEWFDTGDCVQVNDDQLEYVGRIDSDFLNLGTGLKVSVHAIQQRYNLLTDCVPGIVFRPSPGRMGVVAIVFTADQNPEDVAFQQRIRNRIEAFHQQTGADESNVTERHELVAAIGFVAGMPPLTGLGKIDWHRLEKQSADLIDAFNRPASRHPCLVEISSPASDDSSWFQHLMPLVGRLMQTLNLDVEYVDASGDHLIRNKFYTTDRTTDRNTDHTTEDQRHAVLDLVGGFGANLLGHGRKELTESAISSLHSVPILDQFSRRSPAGVLAKALSDRFGRETSRSYVCLFHSTGADAVEAALKHAVFKWKLAYREFNDKVRWQFGSEFPALVGECLEYNQQQFDKHQPLLIALQGSYHGRTIGALIVMSDDAQRKPFSPLLGARVHFLQRDELDSSASLLEAIAADNALVLRQMVWKDGRAAVAEFTFSGIVAAIVEPIQGEGGIYETPMSLLTTICDAKIPLIVDEIQCGLGRSGEFPASKGIAANYYLIGKSLGGGVAKISATLIDRADYCEEFDPQSGATFSNDRYSCNVAHRVLQIIDADAVINRCAQLGIVLRQSLQPVSDAYPQIVRRVTGRGAMLGLELGLPDNMRRFLREILNEQLGYFAASFLLHHHSVRILPTMSTPRTLRIEPSAYLSQESIQQFVNGLLDFCRCIEAADTMALIRHLIPASSLAKASSPNVETATQPGEHVVHIKVTDEISSEARSPRRLDFSFQHETPAVDARRIGFIFNPIYPTDELLVELPELKNLKIDQRIELAVRLQILMQLRPMELFSRHLYDGRVWLCGIMLPASPESLDHWNREGDLRLVRQRLDEALQIAINRGCETVVFGAQTSVVTANATTLQATPGIQISSGNTFTVAAILNQIERSRRTLGLPRNARLAIVGANGNIGSAIARWFSRGESWEGSILLLGRPGSLVRLRHQRETLTATGSSSMIDVSDNMDDLRSCDLIVMAISGDSILLHSRHVKSSGPVLIADVSQPRSVSPTISQERPNAVVVSTGLVSLPRDRNFRLTPHTPRGTSFACAAEGVLMGLEPTSLKLNGTIDLHAVEVLMRLGEKYEMIEATS